MDTIGNQNFVPNSEVSLTQRLPVFLRYRRDLRNWAVEQNMVAFSEFSLAASWQRRLHRGYYYG